MRRYADYIGSLFGPGEGQKKGYDGHQEVELALVKLYRHTGEERYLRMSQFFIDQRGQAPHYYDEEAEARGEDPTKFWARSYEYNQSHKPVREQDTALGHSVRAAYMYSAMADLALETGDPALRQALEKLWDSAVNRRMYITGGIGSTRFNEGWTWDFDLPNDTAYAETCAAIALFLWAHRMLLLDLDARYSDVMERALYNGILSSTDLRGDHYFYVNPLAVDREGTNEKLRWHQFANHRREWYDCACCPPNIARVMASLGGYFYSQGPSEIVVHHFGGSHVNFNLGGPVSLTQVTNYPWDGEVQLTVELEGTREFALRVRVPGWSHGATFEVNGQAVEPAVEKGYAVVRRSWSSGDMLTMHLPLPVERIRANPRVSADAGRVAITRGPLVYCLESVDNGPELDAICLPAESELAPAQRPDLLGGIVAITGAAVREQVMAGTLYSATPAQRENVTITAIPYYAWDNREEGEMRVWVREC